MPGIAGICSTTAQHGPPDQALQRMLRRMARGSHAMGRAATSSHHAALGWFGRDGQPASLQTAASAGSAIVFDGELYSIAGGGRQVAKGDAAHSQAGARLLLEGFLRDGETFLAGLEGRFSAAIWDDNRRQCVLITDKFGSKPLYYSDGDGQLAFASEIKALLSLPGLSTKLNQRGLVQFFAFGHLWNDDTFFTSIKCLDGATVAIFDPAAESLRQERYWRPRPGARREAASSLAELDAQFHAAVQDRVQGPERLGMSLSGGLDGRTILAHMDIRKTPVTCVSYGMEGSLDQRSARRLAELAGCEFRNLVLDQGFLGDFQRHLEHMVDLTDGHYLSQCIVMPTLPFYAQLGVQKLLRGHAGELVHLHKAYNFSVDASVARLASDQQLHDWLAPRLQGHLTQGVGEPLLCGVAADEFDALARGSLHAGLQQTSDWDHPIDRISQLFLDQRTHRETAMSLGKIGSVVDVRVPYLDGRFIEAVFATPVDLRIGERVQTSMLARRRPDFMRPANSNTGARVGASAAWRTFCYYRLKVLAKLGVKGYQPYERLGLWLRRELRPIVEKTLLSPQCLDRGVLQPDAVRAVVRRHLADEQNHTYLIMGMMIVETGFQRLLDRRDYDSPTPTSPAPRAQPTPAAIS